MSRRVDAMGEGEPISFWLKILGGIVVLFGLLIGLPGAYLIAKDGSWYYAISGAACVIAGIKIYQGRAVGLTIYLAVCIGTLIWSFWEVWTLETWFWPLIPRLFAYAFALFFLLLGATQFPIFKHDPSMRTILRSSALVVLAGLGVWVWAMFYPHGVIQTAFNPTKGITPLPSTGAMGNEWRNYGRTTYGTRFAPQTQITKLNIKELQVAWTYHTGVIGDHDNADQNTPIFANDTLYACTLNNQIHAIDAITGKQKWLYAAEANAPFFKRCRGVTYYEIADEPQAAAPAQPQSQQAAPNAQPAADTPPAVNAASGACKRRIAMGTVDAGLISIDADTGKPCQDFGKGGTVDLRDGMGKFDPGEYMQTSAPTVSSGVIVVGGLVLDNYEVGEPSGVIRAFDAKTGAFKWAWDVGRPGKKGMPEPGETFTRFTPNVWTHPAVDEARGMIYLPTGNATPDMWRKHRRPFDDKYNSSVVAIDLKTGDVKWHFQTVHKDVWDYDLPAQPSLYDVPDPKTGKMVPALVQPTKRGQLFYLNRETGEPIAEVIERKVMTKGGAEGLDDLSETQPYSVGMPQIGGQGMSERDMWGATPIDQVFCRIQFKDLVYSGDEFTPPTTKRFFTYPGAQGGMNWGAGSIDENRGIFVVNDLRLPIVTQLLPRTEVPNYKELPGPHAPIGPQLGTPYGIERTVPQSILGLLCSRPPYGTLSAIDLVTRKLLWQRPVGTIESLDFIGVQSGLKMPLGMPTLGGSVITGSGLVFFGSAMDHYLRVFDVETGEEIWKTRMPVGANATPMSYLAKNGKQYIVISAGGATYATEKYRGDYVIAYALPDTKK